MKKILSILGILCLCSSINAGGMIQKKGISESFANSKYLQVDGSNSMTGTLNGTEVVMSTGTFDALLSTSATLTGDLKGVDAEFSGNLQVDGSITSSDTIVIDGVNSTINLNDNVIIDGSTPFWGNYTFVGDDVGSEVSGSMNLGIKKSGGSSMGFNYNNGNVRLDFGDVGKGVGYIAMDLNDYLDIAVKENYPIRFLTNDTLRAIVDTSGNFELETVGGGVIFPDGTKQTTSAFDTEGNLYSDYGVIASTGLFTGSATANNFIATGDVYDDLRIVPGAFSFPGSADPSLQDWQPSGTGATFQVYKFNQSDSAYAYVQTPHAWREGTTMYAHIHWTPADRGSEETTATVAWKVDYSWANIDGTFSASSTVDLTDACQSADDEHLMTPEVAIDGTGKTASSMLILRIYRDTGDTWSGTGAQAPAILEFDLHYIVEKFGELGYTP